MKTQILKAPDGKVYEICIENGQWISVNGQAVLPLVPSVPVAMPSLPQMALNAAGAVGRVVAAVVAGEDVFVGPELLALRKEACDSCERRSGTNRCQHARCGCHLAKKQRLATEACPDLKW